MRVPLIFLLLLFAANSFALEIDKAYRLIPHQQTPFVLHQSNIPQETRHNKQAFFDYLCALDFI